MRNESHNGHKDIAIVTPEHANNTKAIIEASENEREVIMDCYCCRGLDWTGLDGWRSRSGREAAGSLLIGRRANSSFSVSVEDHLQPLSPHIPT